MIHVVLGPDHHLATSRVGELALAADPDQLATSRFDTGTPIGEIVSAIATPGFFGSGRVVIASGVLGKSQVGEKSDRAAQTAQQLSDAVAAGNTLILLEIARESLPKTIASALGPDHTVHTGTPPRGTQLTAWTNAKVAELGGSIDGRTIQHLLDRMFPGSWREASKNPAYDTPPDLQALVSELTKLVTYADREPISIEAIDALVQTGSEDQVFTLVGAVTKADGRTALRQIAETWGDDDDASRWLALLSSSAEMGQIVTRSEFDRELKQTAKELGLTSTGRLYNLRRDLNSRSADALAEAMLTSDRHLKSGVTRGPSAQLQEVVLKRSRKP